MLRMRARCDACAFLLLMCAPLYGCQICSSGIAKVSFCMEVYCRARAFFTHGLV